MTGSTALKLWVCLSCVASSLPAPAPARHGSAPLQLDIIDMAAISRMTPQQLEALAEGLAAQEIMRSKRSSAQALSAVASKASSASGASQKIGLLGQASAGAVSLIASASSKSGHSDEHGYSYEPHEPKVDFWGLKKSILYTLFQAVKAITGGVTILKGQLIKGGGALATSLGKVIAVKGEAVSNLGKKIVNSAALSHKKPHHAPPPSYGPPAHVDYPPSAYGAPTAPAHYHSSAPSAPTGFAAHKYPAHFDGPSESPHSPLNEIIPLNFHSNGGIGRGRLSGAHAGLVILAPLGPDGEGPEPAATGHTPLDPPPSLLHTAFSAIKNVFSPALPATASYGDGQDLYDQPPPPPPAPHQPAPAAWGAVNSYGEPAAVDAYSDYDPRHSAHYSNAASAKHTSVHHPVPIHGLTPEKLQKISDNLDKLAHLKLQQRSSEERPELDGIDLYRHMMMNGVKSFLPTPVVSDAEIGVLPAELLPSDPPLTAPSTTTTTTTTSQPPTTDDKTRRRKDVKFLLRGNKIVIL